MYQPEKVTEHWYFNLVTCSEVWFLLHFKMYHKCKSILSLLPLVIVTAPPSGALTQAIRNFAKSLENWLTGAMMNIPEEMVRIKVFAWHVIYVSSEHFIFQLMGSHCVLGVSWYVFSVFFLWLETPRWTLVLHIVPLSRHLSMAPPSLC